MPYKAEHAARISDPDKYVKIRRENDKFGKGIDVLWGVTKAGDVEVQAIHFDASKFTAAEAKQWLKDHDYKPIEFVEATGKANNMGDIEYKVFRFKMDALEEKHSRGNHYGYIKGYASTFDNVDRGDDVVKRGAFSKCLDNLRRSGDKLLMCWQHNHSDVIGGFDPSKMYEDEKGLWVEGEINTKTSKGADVYELAKQGVINRMSIGFSIVDQDFSNESDNNRTIRNIKEVNLWEISMVGIPMNDKARIEDVKGLKTESSVSENELMKLFNNEKLSIEQKKYAFSKILRKHPLSKNAAWVIVDKILSENIAKTESKNSQEIKEEMKVEEKQIIQPAQEKLTELQQILQKTLQKQTELEVKQQIDSISKVFSSAVKNS